jgi:hypothetical protein
MKFSASLIAGLALLTSPTSAAPRRFDGHSVLRATPKTQAQLDIIKTLSSEFPELDFWRDPSYVNNYVDMQVQGGDRKEAEKILMNAGVDFEVFIEDVQTTMEDSHKPVLKGFTSLNDVEFDYGAYHSLEEVNEWMESLKSTYPNLVELVKVGDSFEGRDITALKFTGTGSNSTDVKPGIWLDGKLLMKTNKRELNGNLRHVFLTLCLPLRSLSLSLSLLFPPSLRNGYPPQRTSTWPGNSSKTTAPTPKPPTS